VAGTAGRSRREREVVGVLDVDSEHLDQFDKTDQHYLEKIVALLSS
jgi:GAF domain-containing protein